MGRGTVKSTLLSRNGHAINTDGRGSHGAAELQVAADFGDVIEHLLEIAAYGDLFYGIGEFSVFNPNAAHASGEVAGHQVYAKAQKLGHVESLFDAGKNLFRATHSLFQKEIAGANPRISGQSAGSISGSCQPKLFGRVGVEQVGLQDAFLNHHSSPAGDAFAIERAAAKTAR